MQAPSGQQHSSLAQCADQPRSPAPPDAHSTAHWTSPCLENSHVLDRGAAAGGSMWATARLAYIRHPGADTERQEEHALHCIWQNETIQPPGNTKVFSPCSWWNERHHLPFPLKLGGTGA